MSDSRIPIREDQEAHFGDSVDLQRYEEYLRGYEHPDGVHQEGSNSDLNLQAMNDIFKQVYLEVFQSMINNPNPLSRILDSET